MAAVDLTVLLNSLFVLNYLYFKIEFIDVP